MMKHFSPVTTGLVSSLVLLLAGCGSDDKKDTVVPPTAKASLSAAVSDINQAISLDGSASTSPNGSIRSWNWQVKTAPANSQAKVAANTAQTTFSADLAGDYQLCLTVTDDKASSAPDCQQLTATNPNPTAVTLKQVGTVPGQQVQLDAINSLPPTDGDMRLLTYQWTLISKPENSVAKLDNASLAQPRFTADLAGDYQLELVVKYLDKVSPVAQVTVMASEVNAMPNPKVTVTGGTADNWVLGTPVTLDASATTDADGDALQYRWSARGPEGSDVNLSATAGEQINFTPDRFGDYSIELAVYDGTIRRTVSQKIKVKALPADHVDSAPVAMIDPGFTSGTYDIELGDMLYLTGNGSYDRETSFSDLNGNINAEWTFLSYPDGFNTAGVMYQNPYAIVMSLQPAGEYKIQLRVQVNGKWSEPDVKTFTARTGANRAPQHNARLAGAGGGVGVGQTITFDGSNSTDPDDNAISWHWQLIDKPDGSNATLTKTDTANPQLVADVAGPYAVEMYVTDSHGARSDANGKAVVRALAKTKNNLPILRPKLASAYDSQQPYVIYPKNALAFKYDSERNTQLADTALNSFISVHSDAFDPDADPLSYLWTLTSRPQGSSMYPHSVTGPTSGPNCTNGYQIRAEGAYPTREDWYQGVLAISEWTCSNISFSPDTAGNYELQLLASDGIDTTEAVVFNIPAVTPDNYPTLLLEDALAAEHDEVEARSAGAYRHQLFPFQHKARSGSSELSITELSSSSAYMIKRYSLSAKDRDYTITNLNAGGQDDYIASFKGLTAGQVIKKGETVTFDLMITTPADMPVNQFRKAGDDPFRYESNVTRDVEWAFEIAEMPGWSFSYQPNLWDPRRTVE